MAAPTTPNKQSEPPAQRADARRNREQLLAAAAELFASSGTDVSLEAIAKRAGVGIGTLYRNFPTRDALVEATYRHELALVCDAAAALLEEYPPDVALEKWMERFVSYAVTKRGMSEALQALVASGKDLFAESRKRLIATVDSLVEPAIASGRIRDDVDAEDVLRAMSGIWMATDEADPEAQAGRMIRLLMDGLRHRG